MVEREPEYDMFQYELAAALTDFEASLNELGIPRAEAMSADADPDNPKGKYRYEARQIGRDRSAEALDKLRAETAKSYEGIEGGMPDSLRFAVRRVDRPR